MHNTDREVPYANDWLEDSKEIVQLKKGEAFVCNPEWATLKVWIRPPLSKLWQISNQEVRRLVGSTGKIPMSLSKETQAVLDAACEQHKLTGNPVKLAFIAKNLGITSRRKLNRIVDELKEASAVKFEYLNERGKPLVIIPVDVHKTSINRT